MANMHDFDNPRVGGEPPRRKYVVYRDDKGEWHVQHYARWLWLWSCGDIPDGHVIHHKDKDKCHDVLDNLECVSLQEHGKRHRGEQHGNRGFRASCQAKESPLAVVG